MRLMEPRSQVDSNRAIAVPSPERLDCPMFGRTGVTSSFGKLDDSPINGLKLPLEVMERAKARAIDAGLPFKEYIREIVVMGVMGRDEVQRRWAERMDAIAGKVTKQP
jgi:hypothetical protein